MNAVISSPPDVPRKVISALEKLPPFSPVVRQVLASLACDENKISLPAIGAQIEQDPLIAGRVLGIANSAMYSRGIEITSIRQAAARLGLTRLRNAVLSLSVNRIWGSLRAPAFFSMARFNLHSLAAATATEVISRQVSPATTDHAFVAGLFHDIGQLLMLHSFPDDYGAMLDSTPLQGLEFEEFERTKFGITHAEVSAAVTAHWNLPEAVRTAVRFHEGPPAGDNRSLSQIVHAGDQYSDICGYSVIDYSWPEDQIPETLLPLGVREDQIRPPFLQELSVLRAAA